MRNRLLGVLLCGVLLPTVARAEVVPSKPVKLVRLVSSGTAVIPSAAVAVEAQDLQTLLSYFLRDLYAGTLGVNQAITSIKVGDGTALLPSFAFASEPALGVWRSVAGTATVTGNFSAAGNITAATGSSILLGNRVVFSSPAVGQFNVLNAAGTIGSQLKVDALPSVSACGAGSPAVVAGSTPFAGSVTIGTTAVATCTITFNGTAFPSAPHCSGAVETTTAANVRAMGYSASATVLTIVPASAWVDSSVVNWHCIGAK